MSTPPHHSTSRTQESAVPEVRAAIDSSIRQMLRAQSPEESINDYHRRLGSAIRNLRQPRQSGETADDFHHRRTLWATFGSVHRAHVAMNGISTFPEPESVLVEPPPPVVTLSIPERTPRLSEVPSQREPSLAESGLSLDDFTSSWRILPFGQVVLSVVLRT